MDEIWKEFEANLLTHSASHYLVQVLNLLEEQGYARFSDVAKKLGIARSSASLGLHALTEKGFLKEDENKFLHLTTSGRHLAKEILCKKIILKYFFQNILKIEPNQTEIDTCKIEHLISLETADRFLDFVLFMSKDPATKKALGKYGDKEEACPGPSNCPVCEKTCLKEMLKGALK